MSCLRLCKIDYRLYQMYLYRLDPMYFYSIVFLHNRTYSLFNYINAKKADVQGRTSAFYVNCPLHLADAANKVFLADSTLKRGTFHQFIILILPHPYVPREPRGWILLCKSVQNGYKQCYTLIEDIAGLSTQVGKLVSISIIQSNVLIFVEQSVGIQQAAGCWQQPARLQLHRIEQQDQSGWHLVERQQ